MSKKKDITDDTVYSEGNLVTIMDVRSEYVNQTGSINRIGFAGNIVIYYHVIFPHHITPITFTHNQVRKES
jgi:hypothetical protein